MSFSLNTLSKKNKKIFCLTVNVLKYKIKLKNVMKGIKPQKNSQ